MGNEDDEENKDHGAESSIGGVMNADPSRLTVGQESQIAPSQIPRSVMSTRSVAVERRNPELMMFDEFLA
jgi:hypothetical protein